MSAVLFWKKRIYLIVSGVLSTLFVIISILYAYMLTGVQTVSLKKSFYFLVSSSTHIETSTNLIDLNGGAGYLLTVNDRTYVAYSVYLTESDGQAVYVKVALEDTNVQLLTLSVDALYLKTREQKSKKEQLEGAFQSFYGCIEVLNKEIERLANGATQESTKKVLTVLQKQFQYLSMEYETVFPSFYEVCKKAVVELFALINDIIYVKDLRYLHCELCNAFVDLAKIFSL